MYQKLAIAALGLIFAMALPRASWAETVMEKIARTGVLRIGTRLDTIPYSYVDNKKQLVGYSIDIVNLIKQEIEGKTGRPVTIQVEVIDDLGQMIPKMMASEIDLACGTQFTWQREQYVDFSIPYSLSGIRLLTKKGNISQGTPESLVGKRIGVVPKSLGEAAIKTVQPKAVLVSFKGAEDGFAALRDGKIDAIAGDTIILAGNAQRVDPEAFHLLPTEPYARYGVACMVPENNSTFLNSVNQAIAKLMQGYVVGNKKYVDMVNKWIGPKGVIELPPELIQDYFETIIISHEQIPLTKSPTVTGSQK
ncbi:extracellular substrate binding-like orphan protein GrrP [Fischerella sp. PCC 9605]|uniref:extracellular substrate binding-like orphan protein GrrP n=1 Tax=Fischerella sp. PCC 9605 TaxID=1173024 RepID=UPI00047AA16E|nr:extracellular substrate binding-like orphan protein GrrP [Fischerella sp. PCC 9605]